MKTMLATLVAFTLASAAQAQDPRLSRRLDAQAQAQVNPVLDSARAAGLPLEPLVDRALEGASKGASGERIAAALRKLATDLTTARVALGTSDAAELEAGASALRAGVSPDNLKRLRASRPNQSLTVPLAVLTDLVARGVPVDTASGYVLTLARASDEQLVAFQRSVERDIALGAPPLTAAAVRVNAGADFADSPAGTPDGTPRNRTPRRP
jgi:hypothetical protein